MAIWCCSEAWPFSKSIMQTGRRQHRWRSLLPMAPNPRTCWICCLAVALCGPRFVLSMELCWWSQSYLLKLFLWELCTVFLFNFIHIWFRLTYPDRDSFRAIGALDRTGDGRLHFFEFLGAMIAAGRIQPLSTKSCLKLWFWYFASSWHTGAKIFLAHSETCYILWINSIHDNIVSTKLG